MTRRPDRVCDVLNCGRKHVSHGLCTTHTWRRKHGKDLQTPIRGFVAGSVCVYQECDAIANTRGACGTHFSLLGRYSLTAERYIEILNSQGGVCAICRKGNPKPLDVDHDHRCCDGPFSCGICIRGLLCRSCNSRMRVIDNLRWVNRAEDYQRNYMTRRAGKPKEEAA